ncbi:hypothetical protein GCM10007049_09090 [Echinicola pacifica]|uniref:DUF6787 domain-containing protein n=1 Tax=Echinicola pacifica TaxID=346377 RepID=A0A918PRL8_9BACT|nr:DUF6787 family protein [Echinicola pacifica]GGZ18963.1 hypothetical protein GCM10007049_09090 [Echinicola pacifica]
MSKGNFFHRLQEKWKLNSLWQVFLVLLAFACTGLTVLYIKQPIFDLLGVDMSTGGFWKTFLYLLLVLPLYQAMLLFYGFVFGQFHFFWDKEKKFFHRIRSLFIHREK